MSLSQALNQFAQNLGRYRFEFCGSQIYMKKSITFCEDAYRCMTFADVS